MSAQDNEKSVLELLQSTYSVPEEQLTWCTPSVLQRYLRARKGVPRDAAKLLHSTLDWRASFGVDKLHTGSDFSSDIESCKMYVAGNDAQGRSVLVTRKRADRLQNHDGYLQYMVFTLESAVRAMEQGQEKWVWIMDLDGYSRANSPPLSVSMQVLRILSDHYPERLEKCYMVDAPSIFWLLFKALSPFIDAETSRKIEFVQGSAVEALGQAGSIPADHAAFYSGSCDVQAYKRWLQQLWKLPGATAPAAPDQQQLQQQQH